MLKLSRGKVGGLIFAVPFSKGAMVTETSSKLLLGGAAFAGVLQKDVRFLRWPVLRSVCWDSRIS